MSRQADGLPEFQSIVRLACSDTKSRIAERLTQCQPGSAAAKACIAALAIREGATAEALRILRRLAAQVWSEDRSAIVDLFVPLLGTLNLLDEAEEVLDSIVPSNEAQRASFAAQRSVILAMRGNDQSSLIAARTAEELIRNSDDPFRHWTVLSRLSISAYYRADGTESIDLALRAVYLARKAGYRRLAAVSYTTARSAASALLANPRLAMLYAKKTTQFDRVPGGGV